MVAPVLRGRGRLGAKYPSGSATAGAWRGLSMGVVGQTFAADANVIEYDTVYAETDGIRSTTSYTRSGFTIPTGAAGVVPPGMGGLWRLSALSTVRGALNSTGNHEFAMVFDTFANDFYEAIWEDFASAIPDVGMSLALPSVVRVLEEGWVIWNERNGPNLTGAGPNLDSYFLMEYLGPVAEEPS